jgi:large subunit ribosomal protein L4
MLAVIDGLALEGAKTKAFAAKFAAIVEAHKTVLFVDDKVTTSLLRASRNIPGVKVTGLDEINVYDLARYEMVVFTEPALLRLAEVLKP